MKRNTISLLLILTLALALLSGCGGTKEAPKTEPAPSGEDVVTQDSFVESEPEYQGPTLLGGIQTAELDVWGSDILRINYDADSLICENYGSELAFFEPDSDGYLSVSITVGDAQENIDSYMSYDWVTNYWASPVTELQINGMQAQSYTHSYTAFGDSYREETVYLIPIGNGMSVSVSGNTGDGSILSKAFLSMEGEYHKPITESSLITLYDPAGNAIYQFSLAPWAEGIELVSNENGKVSFHVTSRLDDGTEITRAAELHVNAYASSDDFFNGISSRYWDMFTPFEQQSYGGRFVERLCFRESRATGTLEQFTDTIFYLELPDGNRITGVCDEYQSFFIGACLEQGFTPAQ